MALHEIVIGWSAAASPSEIAIFKFGGVVFSLYPRDDLEKDMIAAADDSGKFADQGFALSCPFFPGVGKISRSGPGWSANPSGASAILPIAGVSSWKSAPGGKAFEIHQTANVGEWLASVVASAIPKRSVRSAQDLHRLVQGFK